MNGNILQTNSNVIGFMPFGFIHFCKTSGQTDQKHIPGLRLKNTNMQYVFLRCDDLFPAHTLYVSEYVSREVFMHRQCI